MAYTKALILLSFFIHIWASAISASISDFEFPFKCNIDDGECMKKLMTELMQKYKSQGIPEFGIPVMEPYKVHNATASVLNLVNFTMTDGLVEGASSCSIKNFESIFESDEKYIASESFCESMKMSGQYKTEFGSIAQTLIGNSISADGFGSIQIDKMTLKMKIPYEVKKLEDGEIYLIPKVDKAEYSTNDIKKITFNATNVIWGGRDISEQMTSYMNRNWPRMYKSFGKFFSDKVMDTFYGYVMKYFPMVPASKYIVDDLTPFVKVESKKRVSSIII